MINYNLNEQPVALNTGYTARSAAKNEDSDLTVKEIFPVLKNRDSEIIDSHGYRHRVRFQNPLFTMINYNITKSPSARIDGYTALSAATNEDSDLTDKETVDSFKTSDLVGVCPPQISVKPKKSLWNRIRNFAARLCMATSASFRAQAGSDCDDSDDSLLDNYGAALNRAPKIVTRYRRIAAPFLSEICKARQYLTKPVVQNKIMKDAYWNDPQLQGWAYTAVKDSTEPALFQIIMNVGGYEYHKVTRIFKLCSMVSKHLDKKHNYKIVNIAMRLRMYKWESSHQDKKQDAFRAQAGMFDQLKNQVYGYAQLVRLFHDVSTFVMRLRKVSYTDLLFTFYDVVRATTLESAFVSVLKLLHKLNCTQVYLIMLGVSVAQISQHLKRRFCEKKSEEPQFMAQASVPTSWTDLVSSMRSFSTCKRFLQDVYELLKGTSLMSMLFDAHSVLASIHQDIPAWMADVAARYVDQGVFKSGSDYKYSLEITELMKKGLLYQVALQKARVSQASMGAFNTVFRLAQEMARETKAFAITPQARPEPLVIFMRGATGQGKSVLAQTIPVDLFLKLGIPYDPEVDYYRRNETQDHWDGYNHQKVVCFDDMLQSTDPEDLKNALLDFLHLKNELPYPLKMADLSAKANTWFTSPLILITSNNDVEMGPPIKSLGAIMRRRDIFVDVKIKPQFLKDGVADTDKITSYSISTYGHMTMCPEIYNFELYTSGTEQVKPYYLRTIGYDELIELAIVHWNKLHEKRSMIESYIARRLPSKEKISSEEIPRSVTWQTRIRDGCTKSFSWIKSSSSTVWDTSRVYARKCYSYACDKYEVVRACMGFSPDYRMWSAIGAVAGISICAAACWWYWRRDEILESESSISGDNVTKRVIVKAGRFQKAKPESMLSGDTATKRVASTRKFTRVRREAEGSSDLRASYIMERVVATNMVNVKFRRLRVYGLMITNTLLMIPSHLLQSGLEDPSYLLDDEILTVSKPLGGRYDFMMGDLDMVVEPDSDVAFIKLPQQCPSFPNVKHFFITDGELSQVNVKKLLHGACGTKDDISTRIMSVLVDGKFHGNISYLATHSEHKTVMINMIRSIGYTAVTIDGDCGTLVAHMDTRVQHKLMGFHVCAYKDQGHATIITQEIIQAAMVELRMATTPELDLGVANAQAAIPDGVMVVGNTPTGKPRFIPHKTSIKPSMFQGEYYAPETAPASLTTHGPESALYVATKGNVGFELPIPKWMLDLAAEDVTNMLMALPSHYKEQARLLTIQESINGLPGDEYVRQIDVSTSPGFPYVDMKSAEKGKKGFLVAQTQQDGSTLYMPGDFLQQQIDAREGGLRENRIVETFFMDTLKDERRSLDKVATRNTRLFNVAPMDLNLLLRRYCGMFIGHIMQNSLYGEISIGINPHSVAWKMLYEQMLCVGDRFIAGDYSKYDKRLPWQCISYIPGMISQFLGGEYKQELDLLIRSTFNGSYVSKDYTYYKLFGNPSGNTLTSVANSLVNCMLVRICYLMEGREHGISDLSRFSNHVCLKVFGDDNLMSVSKEIPWFNMNQLIKSMAQIGVSYGAASKDGSVYDYLDIADVSYLKRSFRIAGSSVYAPLPARVIREIVNWIRSCPDEEPIMIQMIESAKKEWFHHGRAVYETEVAKLKQLAAKHNLRLPGTVYASFNDQFCSA